MSLKTFLGFDPGNGEDKHGVLVEKIQKKVLSQSHHQPTSLTNGIHLDLVALVTKGVLTRTESASLHTVWALGR